MEQTDQLADHVPEMPSLDNMVVDCLQCPEKKVADRDPSVGVEIIPNHLEEILNSRHNLFVFLGSIDDDFDDGLDGAEINRGIGRARG